MAGLQQQLLDKDAELKAKEGEMSPLVQYCRQQEDYLMLLWRWYKDDYQPRPDGQLPECFRKLKLWREVHHPLYKQGVYARNNNK